MSEVKGRFQGPQNMSLAFQTEPKLSKSEVQALSSRKWAAERFKRPSRTQKGKRSPPPFGRRFRLKTRPKNEVWSQNPFGQHLAPNILKNGAKTIPKRDPKMTHGKLCSRRGESSLLTSNEGSENDLVLESLFRALWRLFWGPALENS